MKFFLLIDGNEAGPYEPEQIHAMIEEGKITGATLGLPENRAIGWLSIDNFPNLVGTSECSESSIENHRTGGNRNTFQAEELLFKESSVENSGVAAILSFIAVFELVSSPIVGIAEGSETGVAIFICGFTGGLILLGFSRIIEHSFESAQRLRRIERLLLKASADKRSI